MLASARAVSLTALGIGLLVGPVRAQEAAGAPRLPADSMELGATYIDWILDYRADSLWAHFSPDMRENFGSTGDFLDGMAEILGGIGGQQHVVSDRYWMRNGKPQYWHTAKFDKVDEPVVFRIVIEPDGTISGLGVNPESQNPPVDDPEQHAGEGP